jgi:outer membrane protein OmpA-like peptidoglycan-associated protein
MLMLAKRWVIAVGLVLLWTGVAGAQVAMSPNPINAGNTILLGTSGSANGTLSSGTNGDNVDVVLTGTCFGAGTGMFVLTSSSGSLTNINLNTSKTITAQYTPMTRGLRDCAVNVFDTGTANLRTTFNVRGTGVAPVVTTTPALPHNFGAVRFNNAAAVHTATVNVRVSNIGDTGTTLVVTDVAPSGGQFGDYTVSGTLPASLAAGAFADFTVTFDPAAAGASATTLQVSTNDPVTPTRNISLSGTGATGVISVTDIAFGTVAVGQSPSSNITVSNIGGGTRGPLAVTQAAFANNTAGWFRFNAVGCAGTTTPCPLSMSMTNGTATLAILCNPPPSAPTGQSQTAMVVFTSDTDDATDSVATVSCTAGRAELVVDQTPLDFGDQLINVASGGGLVSVSNPGNLTLMYSVALVGTDPTHFITTGCTTNCTLGAGMSTAVGVQFRPTTVGAKSAALRVTAVNDPDTAFLDAPLAGNGVAPISTPSALALAFGNIDVGDTSTAQTLTVMNTGTYPLSINAAFLQSGAADYIVTGTTGMAVSITVQPMQSVSWTIACRPSVMGARPGTFRISSNHNGAATNQNIGLTCTGLLGQLVFLTPPPNPYDFGGVREGDMITQNFTLRNSGNAPINNIAVAFTGTGTGYTFNPTTIASLAGGAQITIAVTFAPIDGTYGGMYTGTYTGMWGTGKSSSAALTVTGDGLTTGYDTLPSNPNALDFGTVRFDQTKMMTVNVINTAGSPLRITGLSIAPGTAESGEFAVTRCTRLAAPIPCPSSTTPYNSNGINDTIVLEITVNPNNRLAMMDATLTVASDLAMNPNRTVLLRATSITAGIGLNPTTMVLDFGPTDLDAMPVSVTRTVTLTNTGTAPLDLMSVTKVGGPLGNVRYTFSPTVAPSVVQPNNTYDIQVTYTPIIEKPSNQPDTGSIIIGGVAGVFGGPASITIQIIGYGADRHISVAPAPGFPDTYTNPGAEAPVQPVTVRNTGDAPLHISAALTNDPVWTLVNPEDVTVGAQEAYNFNVRFAPVMAGKAPTGRLTLTNNDNQMPMVAIDLDGNGLDRQIDVGPPTVNFGLVGIGMTTRLSDIDPTQVFYVDNGDERGWKIGTVDVKDGDGAFELRRIDGTALPADGVMVAARTREKFDVLFTPSYDGEFVATAVVQLDTGMNTLAPLAQTVTLKGRGIYVETGGGGGCASTRGSGAAMVLVLLALVLARRRHAAIVTAVVVFGVTPARAQNAGNRNISLATFEPTPAAKLGSTFQLQGPDVGDAGTFGVLALVTYANQPLLQHTSQNDDFVVENRATLLVGGAYAFGAFEVGLRMPLYLQSGDAMPAPADRDDTYGIAPGSTARGDLTAHGKYRLGGDARVAYAVAAALTAPTASKDQFAGNEYPTGRALFLLSLVRGPFTATLNAGGVVRATATLGSSKQGSGGLFGAGLSWRVRDKLWLAGEIFGEVIPGGQTERPAMGEAVGTAKLGLPIEWLAGMRYRVARTMSLGVAAGRGVTGGLGAPMARGVLTLSYAPSAEALKPLRPPRPPAPEKDGDADSIRDELDACPAEPEDKDLFDDADGCPDVDNDADGLADAVDNCPLDAEDKDRHKDEDGCPDKDNDGDGIPDDKDKCPHVSEDKDGYNDGDGCPDPDNDGDGLVDSVDKCPKEPEVINGNTDDDGCPDKGNSLVVLSPDRIETLESIHFNGTRVAKSSHNVLGQLGATLRAHPEIARVRLTVHVQPSGKDAADLRLSEQRAKAVREWLVDWGVDALRLQASGFGSKKPLVPASTKGAKEINERVELIILERK